MTFILYTVGIGEKFIVYIIINKNEE